MYQLFLDDERFPNQVTWVKIPSGHWHIVRNYEQFVQKIEELGCPSFVSFDHDLADEHYQKMLMDVEQQRLVIDKSHIVDFDYGSEKTGYDCAKWLCNYCMNHGYPFPNYQVHSMNPVGKERINAHIENFNRHNPFK